MMMQGFYLDPIYIVLITILAVLGFLGLMYRIIGRMTKLLEDIKSESIKANTTNSGTLMRIITEPVVTIRLEGEGPGQRLQSLSSPPTAYSTRVSNPVDTTGTLPRVERSRQ